MQYLILWIYFIYPFNVDGHLSCFHLGTIKISATVNILNKHMCTFLLDIYLGVEFLVHKVEDVQI